MNLNLAHGDELCCVIEEFVELEWRKYEPRVVDIRLGSGEVYHEDHSGFPPFTSVRFKNESPKLVAKLKFAIYDYKGRTGWAISGHQRLALPGTNWVIRPAFVDQLAARIGDSGYEGLRKYVAEYCPDLAVIAYADLIGLAEHVRGILTDWDIE